ncbi:MAG: hypothetical protein ACJ759_12180 [Thermoanaerobaculia bacterium]
MELSQVGFSEFVGKLLSEVFDAVVTSQVDQRRQAAQLTEAAQLPLAEAASRFVDEARVEEELAFLFPAEQPGAPNAVQVGAPYRHQGSEGGERPPFGMFLGITLEPGEDFVQQGADASLTAAGVSRVREAVRLRLARSHLAALRALVEQGVPQIQVSSGKVAAKLTYQLASQEPAATTAGPVVVFQASPPTPRRSFELPGATAAAAPRFRLAIRQASDRAPQLSQLQVDVYGEVEVQFRTVLP